MGAVLCMPWGEGWLPGVTRAFHRLPQVTIGYRLVTGVGVVGEYQAPAVKAPKQGGHSDSGLDAGPKEHKIYSRMLVRDLPSELIV